MRWHGKLPKNVSIGGRTYFSGAPTFLWNKYKNWVSIGRYCSISRDVVFIMGGHHSLDGAMIGHHSHTKGDIVVGHDVWIGHGATILDGVTIGHGAVVGAMAVVAKDVPPYAVVVGNPARVVKQRFDACTIRRLLRLAWWDWPWRIVRHRWGLLNAADLEPLFAEGMNDAKARKVVGRVDPRGR